MRGRLWADTHTYRLNSTFENLAKLIHAHPSQIDLDKVPFNRLMFGNQVIDVVRDTYDYKSGIHGEIRQCFDSVREHHVNIRIFDAVELIDYEDKLSVSRKRLQHVIGGKSAERVYHMMIKATKNYVP